MVWLGWSIIIQNFWQTKIRKNLKTNVVSEYVFWLLAIYYSLKAFALVYFTGKL
jgi:hypothetical protein